MESPVIISPDAIRGAYDLYCKELEGKEVKHGHLAVICSVYNAANVLPDTILELIRWIDSSHNIADATIYVVLNDGGGDTREALTSSSVSSWITTERNIRVKVFDQPSFRGKAYGQAHMLEILLDHDRIPEHLMFVDAESRLIAPEGRNPIDLAFGPLKPAGVCSPRHVPVVYNGSAPNWLYRGDMDPVHILSQFRENILRQDDLIGGCIWGDFRILAPAMMTALDNYPGCPCEDTLLAATCDILGIPVRTVRDFSFTNRIPAGIKQQVPQVQRWISTAEELCRRLPPRGGGRFTRRALFLANLATGRFSVAQLRLLISLRRQVLELTASSQGGGAIGGTWDSPK